MCIPAPPPRQPQVSEADFDRYHDVPARYFTQLDERLGEYRRLAQSSGAVLMLAYMNRESLTRTLATNETWFWSRSRGELWHKGATSGNSQRVVSVAVDCDGDTLLVRVEQRGPACHTGAPTCFFRSLDERGVDE